jgi:hypothetical protein
MNRNTLMAMGRAVLMGGAVSVLFGCASKPHLNSERTQEETSETNSPSYKSGPNQAPVVDYLGLKQSLGLAGAPQDLGLKESHFETCKVGFGYPNTENCQRLTFAVIRFRIQCRDSETEAAMGLTAADMQVLANRDVRWAIGTAQGTDQTDGSGFGEVDAIVQKSVLNERLKLAVGNQFLHMRASDITRVIVPRVWCEQ